MRKSCVAQIPCGEHDIDLADHMNRECICPGIISTVNNELGTLSVRCVKQSMPCGISQREQPPRLLSMRACPLRGIGGRSLTRLGFEEGTTRVSPSTPTRLATREEIGKHTHTGRAFVAARTNASDNIPSVGFVDVSATPTT